MSLFLSRKPVGDSSAADLHLLGCDVGHTGDAKVSEFFKTSIRKKENENDLSATFRGRTLCGQVVKIPDGYTGLVLKENQKPFVEDEDRTLQVTHQFDKFTYWNLEMAPSVNDAVVKAMAWPEIAEAIHGSGEKSDS